MSKTFSKTICLLLICFLFCKNLFAHNGSVAYAYPLGKITVDGDFSDWPGSATKYMIGTHLSDTKPKGESDFSGFFQLGYRLDNRSLYIAFTVTDDDFIEDTSQNVRWNTQDGLELSIDARHLLSGSGVASFMYSKKLRNTNNAFYDPFAKNATWDIVEVAMATRGTTRFYEWRIILGNEMNVGKSVGFDFHIFDRDADGSFSYSAWGRGGSKYMNPNSLGDVILLPVSAKLATIRGNVGWDKQMKEQLPGEVRVNDIQHKKLWLETGLDSLGNYSVEVPPGKYEITMPDAYFQNGNKVYATGQKKPVTVLVKTGRKAVVPHLTIPATPVPDLIPAKGVLHNFTSANASQVDHFIKTYQQYFGIPGVSLALIKDGKLVYHKTYGVSNTMTSAKVDENTLFEAASITKPVFAFAVQRLAERGMIDLDKPLWLYLPYPDIEYDDRYKLITARHVLTHRTGFPNWRWMNEDGKLNLKFTPGTGYGYSGEGFEYLKMVIEKITGRKVEQVLQEEVIEPMGLYHTFFSKNDSLQRMVAFGHYNGLPSNNNLPESPGMAYSMHTEASIFTRFMLYLLEQKGLKAATYDTMFQKHSDFNYNPGDEKPKIPAYMGMSLEIRETPFGKSFGHGGNNGDFKCKFEVYKDLKMGYAIFTNSNTSDMLLESLRKFLVEGRDTP
ncbi:serine hydrolase [Terrimonas pollutisoli]|uniref:serine hydrolase n=1 Tax=Terrimonas pollutisoli TaxID=3034147 RepID=UPI0023EC7232|nr:serine hydrolase [Terrimonas sp. H1YJ31]